MHAMDATGGSSPLAGRTAVVTGGGSGIGAATALVLAERGARIGIMDTAIDHARTVAGAIRAAGGEAVAVRGDVSDEDDVDHAFREIVDAFGALDVLFNNAGIGLVGSVGSTSRADWDRVLAVNLTGVFLCSRAAIPFMLQSAHASIINNCSVSGLSGDVERAAYNASKGAVLQLTRQMALDYARRIRVNSVSPGAVDTPLQRRMLADPEVAERHREYLDLYVPMQREASAREVGLGVAFLASDDASYITGTNILVDGGLLAGRHSDPRALRDAAADRSQRSTDQ